MASFAAGFTTEDFVAEAFVEVGTFAEAEALAEVGAFAASLDAAVFDDTTFTTCLRADFALADAAFADDFAGAFAGTFTDGFAAEDEDFAANLAFSLSFLLSGRPFLSDFLVFSDKAAFAEPAFAVFSFFLSDFDLELEVFFLSGLAICISRPDLINQSKILEKVKFFRKFRRLSPEYTKNRRFRLHYSTARNAS